MVRIVIISLLMVSMLTAIAGYIFANSYTFGVCHADYATNTFDVSCHIFFNKLGDPIQYGFTALSIIFALLVFFPVAFSSWLKFAIWYVPLAAILFAIAPTPGGGIGAAPSVIGPSPEQIYLWGSAIYVLVSMVIIARAMRRSKGSK